MMYGMGKVKVFKAASALVFTVTVPASVPMVWETEEQSNMEGASLHLSQ